VLNEILREQTQSSAADRQTTLHPSRTTSTLMKASVLQAARSSGSLCRYAVNNSHHHLRRRSATDRYEPASTAADTSEIASN
jgi:hypothetical protein